MLQMTKTPKCRRFKWSMSFAEFQLFRLANFVMLSFDTIKKRNRLQKAMPRADEKKTQRKNGEYGDRIFFPQRRILFCIRNRQNFDP